MGGIDEESRGRVISRDENENGSREIVVDGGGWFKTGRERSSGQISLGVGDRNNCPNLALSAGSLGNFNHESVSAARMVITEGRGPEPSRGMYAREFTADRQRL